MIDPAPKHHIPPRLQNPGDVVRIGGKSRPRDDIYAFLLQAPWTRVLALVASTYIVINFLFATLFFAGGDCIIGARPGSFVDAFFFSVQTFSTIGYGAMAPRNAYGSTLVTLEAFVALVTVAMATGLMFAKFSRPTARLLFSDKMVVGVRDGKPSLMMRVANERGNDVIEASFRLTVLKPEVTLEGEHLRRLHDLRLVRGDTPLFTLAFLGVHVVDEASPIHGLTAEDMLKSELRFIVTVTGLDGTFASTIHARHVYLAGDIVFGARFADVLSNGADGRLILDYDRFHTVVPVAGGEPAR